MEFNSGFKGLIVILLIDAVDDLYQLLKVFFFLTPF